MEVGVKELHNLDAAMVAGRTIACNNPMRFLTTLFMQSLNFSNQILESLAIKCFKLRKLTSEMLDSENAAVIKVEIY